MLSTSRTMKTFNFERHATRDLHPIFSMQTVTEVEFELRFIEGKRLSAFAIWADKNGPFNVDGIVFE